MPNKISIQLRPIQLSFARLSAGFVLTTSLLTGLQAPSAAQSSPQTSQTQPKQAQPQPAAKPGDQKKTVTHPAAPAAQPAPVAMAQAPPAPEPPDWPVNDQPKPANVVWDSRGLSIEASNASLDQILREIATDTGCKIEGLSQDQRIFGSYGPGTAREVLLELLDGSGYNILFIGDLGQGTPRHVELSMQTAGGAQAAKAQTKSAPVEEVEEQPEPQPEPVQEQPQQPPPPPPAQPVANPFGGGTAPRTPQEIMQELQMRQQQQQQQQQQPQQ